MAKAADGFYVATDTQITINGLKDMTGAFVNGATVTGVLRDKNGRTVEGCGSLIFAHVAESDGNYTGLIPASAPLKESTEYDLVLTCDNAGRRMTITCRRNAAALNA